MLSRPIHRPTSPPAFARHVTPAAAVAFVRQYVAFFSDACSRVGLTSLDFNTFVQALPEEVRFSDACSRVGRTSLDFNTFEQALPEEVRRQHTK